MFERFTNRARRVIVIAQEQARTLDHGYIGSEHLLLGLINESDGTAALALTAMHVEFDAVRDAIVGILGPEKGPAPSGHIPFTAGAKKALEFSLREALKLGHNDIRTGHLLLGLLRDPEGAAVHALSILRIDLDLLRQEAVRRIDAVSVESAVPASKQVPGSDQQPENKDEAEDSAEDGGEQSVPSTAKKTVLTPSEIFERLNLLVVGQTRAKKILSVAAYNHYKRTSGAGSDFEDNRIKLRKSNVLMLGPTGSGKTHIARTLADVMDVPFAIADATTLTPSGWIGADVRTVIDKLKAAAGGDKSRAAKGIVFIDEIDKIAANADARISRDSSTPLGDSVQHAMLNMLEGSSVADVDTTNVLFIAGGAFVGIEDVVRRRLDNTSRIRWRWSRTYSRVRSCYDLVHPSDLRKFGLVPEFVGRFPIIVGLEPLDKELLVKILTEPADALVREYAHLLAADGVDLKFTNDALEAIAEKAAELNTGARGLRSIMEEVLLPLMFELPSRDDLEEFVVTAQTIQANAATVIRRRRG